MSLDATHLVAISVGVLITLFFVGGSKNKRQQQEEEPGAALAEVVEEVVAEAAPSTDDRAAAATKKKKKKKKKTKAGSAPAERAAEPAARDPSPPPAPAKEEVEEDSSSDDEPPPVPKKKKNKKKKNGGAAAGNGSANKSIGDSAPVPAATPAPVPRNAYVAPVQAPAVSDDDDLWEIIPKKNNKKKKAQATASAPSSAPRAEVAASTSVTIDASRVGIIIGPKGSTMIAIQEKTGAKLDVNAPKPEEKAAGGGQFRPVGMGRGKAAPKATVVITEGTAEGRKAARKAVQELADRGYATLLQADGFGEAFVAVHPRFLSDIVGTGGRIIKAIQTGLDVKLTIPKTDWTPKTVQIGNIEPSVRVGIAGDSPANVKKAKQVIKDLCTVHHHPVTHPGMVHQEVYVPQELFHCVIGVRGSEIKHIRGNYRVDVYMPSHESWCETENVICVGKPRDVEKAIGYIQLLMDRDAEQRDQKYSDEGYGDDGY